MKARECGRWEGAPARWMPKRLLLRPNCRIFDTEIFREWNSKDFIPCKFPGFLMVLKGKHTSTGDLFQQPLIVAQELLSVSNCVGRGTARINNLPLNHCVDERRLRVENTR
jgi:hypothetical protein